MIFYMGAKPHVMAHTDVPLFISNRHLKDVKKKLPRARGAWALDSMGFSILAEHGSWDAGPTPRQYAAQIRRYEEEIGHLDWAAPQDWMCEDSVIHGGTAGGQRFVGTGLSVAEHLRRTVGNYLDLKAIDPGLPVIPVVQGRRPADYEACIGLYDRAGVDLRKHPVVGVGSVCRIQATDEAADIIYTVAQAIGAGRIHGFGFKIDGLRRVGHLLASADSFAWSAQGRKTPAEGCDFRLPRSRRPHKNEANCLRFALGWRDRVLAACTGQQLTIWEPA